MTLYGKFVRFGGTLVTNSRRASLAAAVVAVTVTMLGLMVDNQNSTFYRRELHARIDYESQLVKAKLESQIKNYLSAAETIASQMAVEHDETNAELQAQIRHIVANNPDFLAIGIAPKFKVETVVPEDSDDLSAGTDLARSFGTSRIDTRHTQRPAPRFFGPILTDGMRGAFVVLYPVVHNTRLGPRVTGAVAALIDENSFYRGVDLLYARHQTAEDGEQVRFAVRDITDSTMPSKPFFGDAAIEGLNPVRKELKFPGGTWEITAAPVEGWDRSPQNEFRLRALLLLAGLVILLPIGATLLLLGDRDRIISELSAREGDLSTLSRRLDLALESSRIGVWEVADRRGNIYFDECAANLHAYAEIEDTRPLIEWLYTVHQEDRERAYNWFTALIRGEEAGGLDYRIIRPNGEVRFLRLGGTRQEDAAGTRTAGIVWDVTDEVLRTDTLRLAKENTDIKNAELELALDELSARERELEELSRKLDLALGSYNCGIWEASLPDGTAFWDERMYQLFNKSGQDGPISVSQWIEQLVPEDRRPLREAFNSLSAFNGRDSVICRVSMGTGHCRYVRLVGQVHQEGDGSYRIVGMAFDMTEDALMTEALQAAKNEADARNEELREAKERIEHNALHDPLTGLANRRQLDHALEHLSLDSRDRRLRFSVLHLDLDRFKQINDTLGHAAGDAMLRHAADILRRNVGADDLVARIGGDEFVILINDRADEDELVALSQRIVEEMRQPLDFEGFPCRCGVSIGIATANGQRIDARKMLINADVALYRAKSEGRNCYKFFTQDLHAEIITTKRTADEILAGLERGEFTCFYQPQFDARTRELSGAEALVRWNHPTKGLLAPDKFLKTAEELNVVQTLDRIVLETALRDKFRWAARGLIVPHISVNVSVKRLHDAGLYETLKTLPITPGEIAFELVEAIFLDESGDVVSENLERVKEMGIEIEIDDFGTGHTSIVSLLKLQPKRLKIDRQLVAPIVSSPKERALVRSIVEIARSLGIETVAEGVETMDHANLLLSLGCDILQGYAFSKALPFEEFHAMATNASRRNAS